MINPPPENVEGVFNDFKARRIGLIKALTQDVDKFHKQCNPKKENLCLYGLPGETWKVNPPGKVPAPLPEPTLGINFARQDGEKRNDWLSLVGIHSDSWLLSVAFHKCGQFGCGKVLRANLFEKINGLPTVLEVFEASAGPGMRARDATLSSEKLAPVQDVFNDFKGRRAGLIKALITDVEQFYEQCDPRKNSLCLYGLHNGTWEVTLPVEELPPEFPEPALAINFARDMMLEKDWLALVALHSDSWLLSVAFYFGARSGFDKSDREKLFQMINDLPTVSEVFAGAAILASGTAHN